MTCTTGQVPHIDKIHKETYAMSMKTPMKPLAIALGATFVTSLTATPLANAAENPFAMSELSGGYMVAESHEGKCGGMKQEGEGKCGAKKAAGEGMMKEGEGMMQESEGMMQKGEGMMQEGEGMMQEGEGMMQEGEGMKEKAEGKCGEGKCGAKK
jgi:uncharacterized low-complexity protein